MNVAIMLGFGSGYCLCEALNCFVDGHAGLGFMNFSLAIIDGLLAFLNYSSPQSDSKP